MIHDIETAKEQHDHNVEMVKRDYFDFVIHQLQHAIEQVESNKKMFDHNGDHRQLALTCKMLSELNLGHAKAVRLMHKISVVDEDLVQLEHQEQQQTETLTVDTSTNMSDSI